MARFAWVSGTRFYWVNGSNIYSIEGKQGALLGTSKAKAIWLEGNLLCYVDDSGYKRTFELVAMNPVETNLSAPRRSVWAPAGRYLEMFNASGEKRRIVHTDHSDSTHADHSDHDDVAAHSDSFHQDVHQDGIAHLDLPAEHLDYYELTLHGDAAHGDSPWNDWSQHQDAVHGDYWAAHDDYSVYQDVPHEDHFDHADYSAHTDYTDLGQWLNYTDHSNAGWPVYNEVAHLDQTAYNVHDDHWDSPHDDYSVHTDSPHDDVLHSDYSDYTHGDTAGAHDDYYVYWALPYIDHSDYEDVPHDDYAAHTDAAAVGHMDSPKLEGTWNQAA